MTRRHAAAAAVVAVAAVVVGRAVGHPTPAPTRPGQTAPAGVDARTVAATASRFVTAVGDLDPAHPTGDRARWASLVTPALDRQLAAHPPTLPVAAPGGTRRITVTSVTVRPGPPPTALVLGVLTETGDGCAPIAWTLLFARTAAGWRVAAVTS